MSREEVLKRIRDAEAERKRTESAALEDKAKLVQEARAEARRLLEEAARAGDAAAAKTVAAETGRISEERKGRVQAGERDIEGLRVKSTAKLDAAVELLVKEFMKQANA